MTFIAAAVCFRSLNVRPVIAAEGKETGMFEVPTGGRRFQALQLLVKQKRLAKNAPVPCVVRDPSTPILAEDDSRITEGCQGGMVKKPIRGAAPDLITVPHGSSLEIGRPASNDLRSRITRSGAQPSTKAFALARGEQATIRQPNAAI
jgi:hypothetical protein